MNNDGPLEVQELQIYPFTKVHTANKLSQNS